jgi:alpha-mannosidase
VRLELEVYHLAKGGRLTATVENRARDHELYAVFPTGLRAGRFIYDSKFDLDSCAVGEPFARIDSVAMVAQGRTALGLVTDCPTLLMSRRSPRGAVELGVSLVRAVGRVCAEVPETMWPAEGAQCLRPLVRRIEWTTGRLADVRRALLRLRRTVWAPPLVAAVTPRASLRYRDPAFTRRGLPREGFLAVEGEDVHLSSWKRSADGRGVCVRVYSLSSRPQVCRVRAAEPARAAFLADLAERRISRLRGGADGGFEFAIRPREIRTVIIELDERLLKR